MSKSPVGSIGWIDLTTDKAPSLEAFYRNVVGWKTVPTSMGDYDDYTMTRPDNGDAVAGVCHARGTNTGIPPQWLMYVTVANLDSSLKECAQHGGQVVREERPLAGGRFAIIEDPAGAVMALYEAGNDG